MLIEAAVDTGTPAVHAGQTLFVSGESSMQRADTPEQPTKEDEAKARKRAYNKAWRLAKLFKASQKASREKNAERVQAEKKAWNEKNPERLRDIQKASSKKNSELVKARCKAYRVKNKAKFKAYNEKYRAANAERVRAGNSLSVPQKHVTFPQPGFFANRVIFTKLTIFGNTKQVIQDYDTVFDNSIPFRKNDPHWITYFRIQGVPGLHFVP